MQPLYSIVSTRTLNWFAIIILTMSGLMSCKSTRELPTVQSLDFEKYAGHWYEIARLPNSFEAGLERVTANYTIKKNGRIAILNKGFSVNKGEYKSAKGTAWLPNVSHQGRLKVRFFWPFSSDYYVIALDKDYHYVLVGTPSRKYLWILSRTKELDSAIYLKLLSTAKRNGFAVENLIEVKHE